MLKPANQTDSLALLPQTWFALKAIALLLLIARAPAAQAQAEVEYQPNLWIQGQDTLPFQLVLPANYQPGQQYPIMVLLHGSGERGNDNQKQLKHFLPLVNNQVVRRKYPFIYVIPQCPAGKSWSNYLRNRDSASYTMPKLAPRPLAMVHDLVLSLEKKYGADSKRRYISGLSMGGFGTFEMLAYYPGVFRAAVPICGGAHTSQYAAIGKTPLWLFHGDMDQVVKVSFSRKVVEAMRDKKKQVVYTELPGVQHDSWVAAYSNPLWLDWLWAQ